MGAAPSRQGRYVVNPDPKKSHPVNPDPNTPSKAKRYRQIRSPVELNLNGNDAYTRPQVAASIRFDTYQDDSARREEFYTPDHTPESGNPSLDSEFYTPSIKGVSKSAETLTCTAPLRRGEYHEKSNHSHGGHMGDSVHANEDHRTDNAHHMSGDFQTHGNHMGVNNNPHGPHMSENVHAHADHIASSVQTPGGNLYSHGVYIGSKANPNTNPMGVNNNSHGPHMGGNINGHGHYISRNDHTNGHYMGGSVVQHKEDGRTVTHFLPYTTSTPRNQGFESTSLFVPYITSTPHKQYQVVPQTPPQEMSPPDQKAEPPAKPPRTNPPRTSAEPKVPGYFSILDAMFLMGSMVMYIVDIIMDILVAVQYFRDDRILWSGMTMAFIIIPSITLQYFSLRWHYADSVEAAKKLKESGNLKARVKVTLCTVMTWLVTHTLQLGAINRMWRTLKFGWRSRSGETAVKDYNHMVCEYRDTTMLRLLEAFMESAPQLVLQLYIMTQLTDIYWLTAASALSSLASLSWSLEAYHKALREADASVKNIGWFGLSFRMTAQTFLITSRVISLALFAAYFEWWVFVVAGGHWLLMTSWLICQKTKFCGTRCEEVVFDGIIGIVHIFCFFNMKPGRTRYRALGYYTLVFAENTVMFALWYKTIGKDTMYGLPALVFVWGGFFVGIAIMLLYYRFMHPDGRILLCDCECLNRNTATVAEKTHSLDAGVMTQVDGPIQSHLPQSVKKSKRIEGNMFVRSGRRHLYWVQSSLYPGNTRDSTVPCTQPMFVGDAGQKPVEGHAFLETSLL